LDERLELYYAGQGEWWLGRVKPDSERRQTGLREMQRLEELSQHTVRPTYTFLMPVRDWRRFVPRWLHWLIPPRFTRHRIQAGGVLCNWEKERQARLMMAGFGLLEQFVMPFAPDGRIVEWFRISNWMYQHTPAHELDRQVWDVQDGKAAKEALEWRLRDYVQTDGRWIHKRISRHQLILPVNGLKARSA
jgi:hypothetical protein